MTAPNTPTPELVERLRFRAWLQNETDGERQVRHLAEREEAAAAIAKLTAERDATVNEREVMAFKLNQSVNMVQPMLLERAEAAEKRVKELEAKLKRITAIGEDNLEKLKSYIDATPAIEASNKLLSERVEVLERIIVNLNPEETTDDSLLRDIHLRLVIHGKKYPDRMVSVLHRNVVFYTIAAAVNDYIGGKKS